MSHVEYTMEVENDMDICFEVRTTLLSYGIGMSFERQTIQSEKITYTLKFYQDKELRLELSNIIHLNEDPFAMIREIYDAEEDKNIAIYHISEYVQKYAFKCTFKYIDRKGNKIFENYRKKLSKWIHEHGIVKFEENCHKFTSSYQIRIWFRQELIKKDEQMVDDDENEENVDIENYGILRLKKKNFEKYKKNIMDNEDYTSSALLNHYEQSAPNTAIRDNNNNDNSSKQCCEDRGEGLDEELDEELYEDENEETYEDMF